MMSLISHEPDDPLETWLKPVLAVTQPKQSDRAVRPSSSCSVFSAGQTLPGFSVSMIARLWMDVLLQTWVSVNSNNKGLTHDCLLPVGQTPFEWAVSGRPSCPHFVLKEEMDWKLCVISAGFGVTLVQGQSICFCHKLRAQWQEGILELRNLKREVWV